MTVLTLTITDAGRNALVNAANTGTLPLALDKVVLGRACYVPTAVQPALHDPIKPLTTFGGSQVADDTIHITITDDSHDAYSLGEIGLYSGGVLFAVYSQALPILEKGPEQMVLLSADIQFLSLPANSVTVGSTEFAYPQGNELRPGVLEIATPDEATTGKDHTRAITPLTLKQGLDTKLGKLEVAVAAAKWSTARQFVISGDGSGMALVDGSGNVVLQLEVNDNSHGHSIENVSGLATALSNKLAATANAVSASRWATSRLFKISGNANGQVYLDGSGDVELNLRVTSADAATILDGGTIKAKGQDLTIWDKRAMVGANSANQLIINYAGDWGSTLIQGQTYLQTVESNRHVVVHNGATSYQNAGLELRVTDGSDVRIGMHRSGSSAGSIVHNSWGFQFERESPGSRGNVAAANFFTDAEQSLSNNALTRLDYVRSNFLKYSHRLMTDDGTSIDNVSREYGFNYQTGGGVFGPYISFGGMSGNYDCQINADYGSGNEIRFRTRNGDSARWNSWHSLWHAGNFDPNSKLTNGGSGDTLHLNNWFRSSGATGWYNETYQGGIYMDEPTTIKIHNGKKFYTANAEYNAIAATGGIFSYQRFSVDTRAVVGTGNSFNSFRYTDAPFHAGFGGLNVGSFAPIVGSANYTNGYGYTTRIQFGALTQNGTGWADAVIMVGSAENDAHPLAAYYFGADGHTRGLTALTLSGNANIGNDMTCSYAYANGAQPQVGNALTRKDYVDAGDYATRWNNSQVINHSGGDANAHYNSAWDGNSIANAPSANWYFFRELYHSNGGNWRHQEAFEFFADEEWFRRGNGTAGDYGPWRRRWHSGNFDPASKSDVGHTHSSLATARTITLASELAGSASFDGSKDITINATTIKHQMFSGVSDSVTFSLAGAVGNTNSVIEVTILAGSGFAMGHLPLVTAKQYPSGYSMFVDYGDGEDFIFSWSYNSAANTVTLTNTGRGDFVRVVVTH